MLSFMKDDRVDPTDAVNEKNQQNSPEKGQDFISVSSKSGSLRKSTTLVGILFIVGGLCLWLMIKKSTPQAASAEDTGAEELRIEKAIAQLTGGKAEADNVDHVLDRLYEYSDVEQVQVNELAKNPFEFEVFAPAVKKSLVSEEPDELAMLRMKLEQKSKSLKLLSIIQSGHKNGCMINDSIVYEGDSVEGFEVVHIGQSSVTLRWILGETAAGANVKSTDLEIELKLSE